jgi:hypothetical protein
MEHEGATFQGDSGKTAHRAGSESDLLHLIIHADVQEIKIQCLQPSVGPEDNTYRQCLRWKEKVVG